jgi:nucleoside-diphosphate-sugar epimerase
MKVAVTGANGFLGSRVVASLLSHGHEVVALVRSPSAVDSFDPDPALEVRRCDLRTDPVAEALRDAQVVVHCAAQVTGSDEARFASTVVGTERLLAALDPTVVSQLVLVSSYSVYDWTAALDSIDESTPTADLPYNRDGYTVAKVWQERIVTEYGEASPVDVVVLRPGFVWGPGNEVLAGAGLRVGSRFLVVAPTARLPLTYVDNCADAVTAAVDRRPSSGTVINIVDGRGVTAWEYARRIVDWEPTLRGRIPVPYSLFNAVVTVLALVMPRIFRHGGKLPGIFMRPSFKARFRPLRHGAARAGAELGWRPRVSFADAARLTFPRPDHR